MFFSWNQSSCLGSCDINFGQIRAYRIVHLSIMPSLGVANTNQIVNQAWSALNHTGSSHGCVSLSKKGQNKRDGLTLVSNSVDACRSAFTQAFSRISNKIKFNQVKTIIIVFWSRGLIKCCVQTGPVQTALKVSRFKCFPISRFFSVNKCKGI